MATFKQAREAKIVFNVLYRPSQSVAVIRPDPDNSEDYILQVLSYDLNFDPASIPSEIENVKVVARVSPLAPKTIGCGKKPIKNES